MRAPIPPIAVTVLGIATLLAGACGDDEVTNPPAIGSVEVSLAMTGNLPDSDGCIVAIDDNPGDVLLAGQRLSVRGLAVGTHTVTISDVALNCFVQGESSRSVSVSANQTTLVPFAVDCPAPGSIEVATGTAGSSPFDPDGYTITLDSGASLDIGVSDAVTFPDLAVGEYEVELTGVADNCAVFGENPITVAVTEGEATAISFGIACPPFYDHIAFTRNSDIWVMGADGSNPVNLTNDEASSWGPAWSPDGTRIAFTHGGYRGPGEVYVLGADGSNPANLTNHDASDGEPAWSPDGARIAVTTDRDGNSDIWVMGPDGSNPLNLTNHEATDSQATWSPDGTRIAFTSGREGNAEIYVMDSDGSNPVNITNDPATDVEPHWSPVGDRIVFWTDRGGTGRLYTMDADGANPTHVISQDCMWDPAWSPDGQKIAYSGYCGSPGGYEILVVNVDGSNQVNLTNSPGSDSSPAWSPGQ